MSSALAPSSKRTYARAISVYKDFVVNIYKSNQFFPTPIATILTFIAYLHNLKMSASSVTTYVTALSFVNKLRYSVDPTSSFIVKKMLAGL